MMLCVVIKGPSFKQAHQQISKVIGYADLVELRLDCFQSLDFLSLKTLRSHFSIPMIFTLRSQSQGGNYIHSEEQRLQDIYHLIRLNPEYIDLESHVSPLFISDISLKNPKTQLILSYHHFSKTPKNLLCIYEKMQKIPAAFYKIALKATNCLDALRLLCFAKQADSKLIAISLGPHGQISRILSPIVGCPFTYASLEENPKCTLGQLSFKTLLDRYHYRSLSPSSSIYGLIGDPVDLSISDETHNQLMKSFGLNAVYIKIQVSPSELFDFLQLAKRLSFQGLSVTMPLKEPVVALLDEIDPQALHIGAVNTLLFKENRLFGFNTDGVGALNALESQQPVKGKRILIIGCGGAGKAIACEALKRGGDVTIVNRDKKKARLVAKHLNCVGKGLDYIKTYTQKGYDILIQCTPSLEPIPFEDLTSKATFMEIITKPKDTPLLKQAKKKGFLVIYGYRLFIEQALGQFNLWFSPSFDIQKGKKILEKSALKCLSLD